MQKKRFLVKSYGDNKEGAKAGLIKTISLLDNYNHAVIVVPQIGQVKNTMLTEILGKEISDKLIKEREITFDGGKKMSLCGQATLKNQRPADIYLALWGSKSTISEIESLSQWNAAVLVTWLPEDSKQWESENSVEVIYDDKAG